MMFGVGWFLLFLAWIFFCVPQSFDGMVRALKMKIKVRFTLFYFAFRSACTIFAHENKSKYYLIWKNKSSFFKKLTKAIPCLRP